MSTTSDSDAISGAFEGPSEASFRSRKRSNRSRSRSRSRCAKRRRSSRRRSKSRRRSRTRRRSRSGRCARKSTRCCGYKKRRYCCPGKRRYKTKQCSVSKITLCNRNWARISVHPFINFLRCFRRRVSKDTPPNVMAAKGRIIWKRMSPKRKAPYIEQAKRARCRGYTT